MKTMKNLQPMASFMHLYSYFCNRYMYGSLSQFVVKNVIVIYEYIYSWHKAVKNDLGLCSHMHCCRFIAGRSDYALDLICSKI